MRGGWFIGSVLGVGKVLMGQRLAAIFTAEKL
jgi:hypothetical protein